MLPSMSERGDSMRKQPHARKAPEAPEPTPERSVKGYNLRIGTDQYLALVKEAEARWEASGMKGKRGGDHSEVLREIIDQWLATRAAK